MEADQQTDEDMEFLDDCFKRQCDEDGFAGKREIFNALCEAGKCPTFTEINSYWKAECTDDTDVIDIHKYRDLCKILGKGELRLREALDQFDTDGNGYFDRAEFKAMVEKIDADLYGSELDSQTIDDVFDMADGQGGQKDGHLDKNELVKALCSGLVPVIPPPKVIIDD